MYNYAQLKSALNSSPGNYTFGKWKPHGTTLPPIQDVAVVWDAMTGESYRRIVLVSSGSSSVLNRFVSNNAGDNVYEFDHLRVVLEATPGAYYKIQCGGCGNIMLLVKVRPDQAIDDTTLTWNVLRFFHAIQWFPTTATDDPPLGIPQTVAPARVLWTAVESVPAPDVHWVWFRRNGAKLRQEIVERATSWIALNPASSFHLWTDLASAEECAEFMDTVADAWRAPFLERVTIHYREEFQTLVDSVLEMLDSEETRESITLFRREWASKEKQATVYKTDFARLFVLYARGGVYADFNDLLCLAPVDKLLAVYGADTPLGVSDIHDAVHASNYFLYCPARSAFLFDVLKDMMRDLKHLLRMIRDDVLEAQVKQHCLKVLDACAASNAIVPVDTRELHEAFHQQSLPYIGNEHIPLDQWERILYIVLAHCAPDEYKHAFSERQEELMQRSLRRARRRRHAEPRAFRVLTEDEKTAVRARFEQQFHESFLFWWTDNNLRVLMHFTNMPMYCRMRRIGLVLVPFGYYFSYGCCLSWFAHLGDGTSYGMDGRKDAAAATIYSIAC